MGKKFVEIIARGVCVRRGRILLCHSKGAWNTFLPGGHVEFGESATESLVRELREETGLPARAGRFLGAVEHTFLQKGRRHCEINLVFSLQIPPPALRRPPASREAKIEFLWADLGLLRGARLEPGVLQTLIPIWLEEKARKHGAWGSTYRRQH